MAIVLSGGGVTGLMLEMGFLNRLRESEIWPRVGWIYGTSAGAMAGTMAALDRLPDLEEFLLGLQPEDAFRPNPLWRLPLLGSHIYTLPETVDQRLGGLPHLGAELIKAPIELNVIVTDVTPGSHAGDAQTQLCERIYSAHSSSPEEMIDALFASAAVSVMVSPLRIGDRIATDGGWVRNFPLGYAYANSNVNLIASFRYEASEIHFTSERLERYAKRFARIGLLRPAKALARELNEAVGRSEIGQPLHAIEGFMRLMQISVLRNTALEEVQASEKEKALIELESLKEKLSEMVGSHHLLPGQKKHLRAELERIFSEAHFPFRHDRLIPRIAVSGAGDGQYLDAGFRRQIPWEEDIKKDLISRGYALCDAQLKANGFS